MAILSHQLIKRFIDAGIVPAELKVRRMLIDMNMHDAVKIFYETIGDDKLLHVDLNELKVEVVPVADMPEGAV